MSAEPSFIEPMELLAVTRLPEGPEWSYEVKLDGYRAQANRGNRLRLFSRRGRDFSSQFAETFRALASAVPVQQGVDLYAVGQLLGHKTPRMTHAIRSPIARIHGGCGWRAGWNHGDDAAPISAA